ncbi:cytosine-purine permease [Ephemerocybe angulata]|uniref:Cytosine-purine permease n=1 Tax=Ephemerocybe angulata TaxID=980116 RepID=A0A8H6HPG8_9AGAR|nr:cytosine-purine permease [Tulosesus angulatus]
MPISKYLTLQTLGGKFGPNPRWSNPDMDPVPPRLRTWTAWNYVAYWVSDATNVAGWQLASSMLAVGLTWRQALAAIAVGHTLIAVVVLLNGTVGARLHVAFPVLNRSSFGFWLSYFSVVSRVVLAMFWFGIQTYTGSEAVYQMLKAIWPSLARLPNQLSDRAHITTTGILCYFLYWLIQFPFMLFSPQRIRHLFTFKAVVVPCAWIAILIWAMVKVPPRVSLSSDPPVKVTGSSASWLWLGAMNSALGNYATLSVNIPDFTRYAKSARSQYIQILVIPISFTLIGFIGIAVTSAGSVLYGSVLWDPLHLIDRWDDNRAAAFFAAFSFVLATLGTNISANSLSAANDMTVLFPRWISIRRGQVVCAVVGGWALAPWEILASAPGFLTFMAGYTVFLGPFAGIMVVDYWLLHKGNVNVVAMYDPNGIYRYWNGINWRAAAALLASVTPNLPGLINNINPKIAVGNARYLFNVSWLFGFFVASGVYWALSALFPARETYMDAPVLADEYYRDNEDDVDSVKASDHKDSREKVVVQEA